MAGWLLARVHGDKVVEQITEAEKAIVALYRTGWGLFVSEEDSVGEKLVTGEAVVEQLIMQAWVTVAKSVDEGQLVSDINHRRS